MGDWLAMKIAYALPRRVVYWAAIRLGASGTTGKWANDETPGVSFMDLLQRWVER